ncbi:MAG TPA: HAD hydrolase-like protein [Candidatus Hydrogenedentes bacterium]|nr:HAD hydrolase-like protein [Candidatus Hydrogenedentota bacterium]HQE83376.1 HAD hydrolase-like protein [Candidatus Hydrogenedentota bacterium]HQH53009.1 HAD hydrolase-like protein [Candidatus Hydrogenedentota bacterium]HQM49440.1 HAD hydrolase-like protein [Candidatus Hydrogenedentota bacterium]
MKGTELPGTQINVINEVQRGRFKHVLFDFDGTVSLLREGWQLVMGPLMVEMITGEAPEGPSPEIEEEVREYIEDSTGIQTILQMERLVEMVKAHGNVPEDKILDSHGYKKIYNDRLMERVSERIRDLENGTLTPKDVTLRGALDFLERLSRKNVIMYIFSGTDRADVRNEARLVGVAPYFQEIWGALREYKDYNKEMVLKEIIATNNLHGSEVLIVGDGPVEIRNAKDNDCVAVGVASDEIVGHGWNMDKYPRLVKAGADIMIPDFSDGPALIDYLFPH